MELLDEKKMECLNDNVNSIKEELQAFISYNERAIKHEEHEDKSKFYLELASNEAEHFAQLVIALADAIPAIGEAFTKFTSIEDVMDHVEEDA